MRIFKKYPMRVCHLKLVKYIDLQKTLSGILLAFINVVESSS